MKSKFEEMNISDVYSELQSSSGGLNEGEAENRLKTYGKNEVAEKKESNIIKFLKKFWTPVAWMLEATIITTLILKKYDDMYIISFLLIFNSIISYSQESKASNALELLKKKLSVKATVLREGQWKVMDATFLVPGDIVHIKIGDVVPGDAKIIAGKAEIDQSALTGESMAISKNPPNLIYSSSIIKRGECDAVIVSTGKNTFFGKTAELVNTARAKSHMESLIMKIVKYLVIIDVALVLAIAAYSIFLQLNPSDVLPFILVILIASVPVALPATFTIAMALGALTASENGALVTRLSAIEDAASLTTLYMDKTGTITNNKLSVAEVIEINEKNNDIIYEASMASENNSEDPIDDAILTYAGVEDIKPDFSKRISYEPFDPSTKRTEALMDNDIKITKGAPQEIAKLCIIIQ